MSNLKYLLQTNIKSFLPDYNVELDEIVFMLEDLYENDNDYRDYEIYFDEKCLRDYLIKLKHQIIKDLEQTLKKSKQNLYKSILVLHRNINKIKTFLDKVINYDILVSNYEPYKKLSKQVDIYREAKKTSMVEKLEKEMSDMKKHVSSSLAKTIKSFYDDGNLNYNFIKNDKSEDGKLLMHLINQMVSIKDIKNKRFIDDSYANVLISLFTDEKYDNLDTFIGDYDFSSKNSYGEDLNFLLTQYKFLKDMVFEEFTFMIRELYENNLLNIGILSKIQNGEYDKITFTKSLKVKFLINIFINILMECDIPYNQTYMNHLKRLYINNQQEQLYSKLEEQSKVQMELLDIYNLIAEKIVAMNKNGDDLESVLYYILQFYINKDILPSEYEELSLFAKLLYKLGEDYDRNFELLNNHINKFHIEEITSLTQLQQYKGDATKDIKLNKFHDEYISTQLQLYEMSVAKKDFIYLSAPQITNDNMLNLFSSYEKWLKVSDKYNKNFHSIIKSIYNGILAKIFSHFIKAFLFVEDVERSSEQKMVENLYYLQNDNPQIRIYTKNSLEQLFTYLSRQLQKETEEKELYEFSIKTLLDFMINYKFSSESYDESISIYDIIRYHDARIITIVSVLSDVSLKDPQLTLLKNDVKKINQRNVSVIIEENSSKTSCKRIITLFKDILSEDEMRFVIINYKDYVQISRVFAKNKQAFKRLVSLHMNELKVVSIVKNDVQSLRKIQYHKTISPNELIALLNKESGNNFKINKVASTKKAIKDIVIGNIGTTLTDNVEYHKNEMSFVELSNLRKMFKNKEDVESYYNEMVKVLSTHNINYLNNLYKTEVDDSKLTKLLIENNKYISAIKNKYLKYLSVSKYEYSKRSLEFFNNIIKFVSILYFIGENKNTLSKIMKPDKLIKTFKENVILKKKVLLLKENKIGTIVSRAGSTSYKVKVNNTEKEYDDMDFVILDDMKNKMVKINTGEYKGKQGIIQQGTKYMNDKEKQTLANYIKQLNRDLVSKNNLMNKYIRTKTNQDQIPILSRDIDNINNELKLSKMKLSKKTFLVKIFFGSHREKNIRLNENEITPIIKDIQKEKINDILQTSFKHYKVIHFSTIYDIIKYLFNSMQDTTTNFKHFEFLYKNTLKIINGHNVTLMNKLQSLSFLREKIDKVDANIEKINKKLKKSSDSKTINLLKKQQKIKSVLSNKLRLLESNEDLKEQTLMSSKIYENDFSFESVDKKYFPKFIINTSKLDADKKQYNDELLKRELEQKKVQDAIIKDYVSKVQSLYSKLTEELEEYNTNECSFVNSFLENALQEEVLDEADIEALLNEDLGITTKEEEQKVEEIIEQNVVPEQRSWVDIDEEDSDELFSGEFDEDSETGLEVVNEW